MIIIPGTTIYDGEGSNYTVIKDIGAGAFGQVYKVEKNDGTIWAVKIMPSSYPDHSIQKAFVNECQQAVKISHSNAIKYIFMHDGNQIPSLPPYILMEYANDGTLSDFIKQQKSIGYLSNERLLDLFNQLISGMEHVNSVLIHRDIKPDNILIHDSVPKISDFGLSKVVTDHTRASTFKGFGHLRYMPPETWKNETNTIQIDIYSMGIVFFELACLQFPFSEPSDSRQWREVHLFQKPTLPNSVNSNLSIIMNQVILKMLEKSTTTRYKNWNEIREDLKKVELPQTEVSSIVDNLVQVCVVKDNAAQEKLLKEQKEKENFIDNAKLIHYQFETGIYRPVEAIVTEFNKKYTGKGMLLSSINYNYDKDMNFNIRLLTNKSIDVHLRILVDEDFMRDVTNNDFGHRCSFKKLRRPTMKEKKVIAWGYIEFPDNRGFNIVLVENENDMYGEWYIIKNKCSFLSREQKPEPFFFDLIELERQIQYINVMHTYEICAILFNIDEFIALLVQNL